MLDQLRIKCPSCGIILDVRNSRHEALKQIVCPNCKKQLAVNFEEDLELSAPHQPIEPFYYGELRIDLQEGVNKIALPDSDKAEIKVLRLKDGNVKCMVRPLSDTVAVRVNGQPLQLDEQVVMSKGDFLEIGRTRLSVGAPGTLTSSPQESPVDQRLEQAHQPLPRKEHNYIWLYAALAFVVLMAATIYLWPSDSKQAPSQETVALRPSDTIVNNPPQTMPDKPKDATDKSVEKPKTAKPKAATTSVQGLSDFDLEKLAYKGDTEAQYELGVKLIKRGGESNVVRGIKYLKVAANNGSSKAKTALGKAIHSLQNQANQGDSIAYYILKSI